MNIKILIAIIVFPCAFYVVAQERRSNPEMHALIQECQQQKGDMDQIQFVWWIPSEMWEMVFDQSDEITDEMKESVMTVMRKYVIVAINFSRIEGELENAQVITRTKEDLFKKIYISQGSEKIKPLADQAVDENLMFMLNSMKPFFKNLLGDFGNGIHFFVFEDVDASGARLIDPKIDGTFKLKVEEVEFMWSLPLDFYQNRKICPIDSEPMNKDWNYCPIHGEKLEQVTIEK
ncbi:MAG: hypothetical protein R2799_07480 [Crocinitomicaceae bacterium]